MKLLSLGGLWALNCGCWLAIGAMPPGGDASLMLLMGLLAIVATVAMSMMLGFREEEPARRRQVNPDRHRLTLPLSR